MKIIKVKGSELREMLENIVSDTLIEGRKQNELNEIRSIVESVVRKTLVESYGENYTHFLLQGDRIINGWDYSSLMDEDGKFDNASIKEYSKMDVIDMGLDPKTVKVYTRRGLEKKGINPNDDANWGNLNEPSNTPNMGESCESVNEELHDVIHKEGDNWKIRGHKGKGDNEADGDWNANYKSKESAEKALKAYFANK